MSLKDVITLETFFAISALAHRMLMSFHVNRSTITRRLCWQVLALALLLPLLASAQVLQTQHAIRWAPGVTVGVRGSIPARTNIVDVTLPPFNADKSGVADATAAIQAAVNQAPPESVIFLPNGRYLLNGQIDINKSDITLRGESRDNTILVRTNSLNGMVRAGGADIQTGSRIAILSGFARGSTNVSLVSASEASVGDIVAISMLNPVHPTFHVISVAGYERLIDQRVVVTSISNGTNLTFSPPLIFDFTNSPSLVAIGRRSVHSMFASKHRIGVENLTLSQTNRINGTRGSGINMLVFGNAVDSWVTGVRVEWPKNYAVNVNDVVHFYFGDNEIINSQNPTPSSNNAGLLTSRVSAGLFENNVFANRLFPAIEFNNGFSGNALFGNFFTNNVLDVDCHNAHSMMNLWEGNNFDNSFEMDGYFGSASHQVLWRNAIQSTFIPVLLKRWTTYMHVVGNVLGRANADYVAFTHHTNGVGRQIIEMGRPNIGNNNYIGIAPPEAWNWPGDTFEYGTRPNGVFVFTNIQVNTTNLVGNFTYVPVPVGAIYPILFQDGANTNRYFTSVNGSIVLPVTAGTISNLHVNVPVSVKAGDRLYIGGQTAFQQLQKAEAATHVIHGNYDYFNKVVTWSPSNSNTNVEPSILYPGGPPVWWGTNRWPAIQPGAVEQISLTPAHARFLGVLSGGGDQQAPSFPQNVSASASSATNVTVTWTASSDNIAVTAYYVERSQGVASSSFFHVGTRTTFAFTDTSLSPSTTYNYRIRAGDAAGNLSGYSSIVTVTTPAAPDASAPSAPTNVTASALGSNEVILTWSAATDNVGVTGYRLERSQGAGSASFAQIATPASTTFTDRGLEAGSTYNYRVRAVDGAGNLGLYSVTATATTPAQTNSTTPAGLVAAWAFDDSSFSTATDSGPHRHRGTYSNLTFTPGRFGRSRGFNGSNSVVLIEAAPTLNLTSNMTLQAWVYPTVLMTDWHSILHREIDAWYLHVSSPAGSMVPAGGAIFNGGEQYVAGPAAVPTNQWTHLATTYDGATLRLYVNGEQVAARPMAGLIESNNKPLRIGGNTYPGQFFQGRIDEVRVYNRALSAAEIQSDMMIGITPTSTLVKPAAPTVTP